MKNLFFIVFDISVILYVFYTINLDFFLFINSFKHKKIILVADTSMEYKSLLYKYPNGKMYTYLYPQTETGFINLSDNGEIKEFYSTIKSWRYIK